MPYLYSFHFVHDIESSAQITNKRLRNMVLFASQKICIL